MAQRLEAQADAIEHTANASDVQDRFGINKFCRQISDLASHVEAFCWLVLCSLCEYALDKTTQDWLMYKLLPAADWHRQWEHCKNPFLKGKYEQAYQTAWAALHADPFTAAQTIEAFEQWCGWAQTMSTRFHRGSSAV